MEQQHSQTQSIESRLRAQSSAVSTAIAIVWGGESAERDVSRMSAVQVERALISRGYQATLIDADATLAEQLIKGKFAVAFLVAHGKGGEDGCVQAICELTHTPYTGSDVLGSALCYDKVATKEVLQTHGLAVPAGVAIPAIAQDWKRRMEQAFATLGSPMVVKPRRGGSTLGFTLVTSAEQLPDAFAVAAEHGDVLCEQAIAGMEVTVGVVGDSPTLVLDPLEIVNHRELYDYDAKYTPGASEHVIPARLSATALEACRRAAQIAHASLYCRDMSRTDMIVDREGTPWVLETNTLPGLTEVSLLPDAARAAGISFPDLCELLLTSALRRTT